MLGIRKLLAVSTAVFVAATMPISAAQDTSLRAVRGTVGYQPAKDAAFTRVFGSYLVKDNEYAVTQNASNGLIVLADSSEVALGESTTIQVGTITQAAAATPNTLTLVSGAIRFAVKHPAGAQSNYRFVTSTSQLAVRGTVGLYSTGPNGDVISCLECAPGDVTVTAGTNTFGLVTGQTATISIGGVVTVAATAAQVATTFANAGLSTVNSASPFAPGISASTAAAAGAAGTTAAVAGAAAAAAVGVGVAATTNSNNKVNTVPVQPTASPTPSSQSGSALVQSHAVAPAATPAPATVVVPTSTVRESPAAGGRR